MEIRCEHDRVSLSGEVDIASARLLDAQTMRVLDLSEVTFMDCAGVAALVRARDRAHARGEELVLEGPSEPVVSVLRVTRLDGMLAQEARDALRAAGTR